MVSFFPALKNKRNKKKGVAEFMDLTKAFNPNFDKKFSDYHQSNPRIFHVYNGVFSHMYDAAHRNGNIVIPFRNNSQANNDISHHNNGNYSSVHHFSNNNHHSPKNTKKSKSPK